MEPLPAPMLPTAGPLPTGSGWRFEFKFDGDRVAAEVVDGRLRRLQSRLGNDLAPKFPELVDGVDLADVVLDGELVILTDDIPDWEAVERRRKARQPAVADLAEEFPATVMVFDVLRLDGVDLRRRPYRERRAVLEGLDLGDGWVVPPVSGDGQAVLAASLAFHLEGVVAKRENSPYRSGRRTRDWIKTRHKNVSDAVVVGWRRRDSGGVTLLLAEATDDEHAKHGLFYLGRCTAPRAIADILAPLAVRKPALEVPDAGRDVQWVRPELEVEVVAASRTPAGRLRQPRFIRARVDLLGG